MADPNDSSLQFYRKATPAQWSFALKLYPQVLRLKAHESRGQKKNGPEQLINLDNWYQYELPKLIRARKEPHLTHEELVQVTKWRLMRGKFRPRLIDLVRINTELAVTTTTKKAFKKITKDLAGSITALTTLKGVGPASASAVLAAGFPEIAPYMADECMISTPGIEVTDYTIAEYTNFADQIRALCEKLKEADPETNWNPHKVELALWTHYIAKDLKPELLDDMPGADVGISKAAPTNGNPNTNKMGKGSDEEEDDPVAENEDDSNDSGSKGEVAPVAASTQANGNSAPDSGVLTDESSNSAPASDLLFGDGSNDNSQSRDATTTTSATAPEEVPENRLSSKSNGKIGEAKTVDDDEAARDHTEVRSSDAITSTTKANHLNNSCNEVSCDDSISSSCASDNGNSRIITEDERPPLISSSASTNPIAVVPPFSSSSAASPSIAPLPIASTIVVAAPTISSSSSLPATVAQNQQPFQQLEPLNLSSSVVVPKLSPVVNDVASSLVKSNANHVHLNGEGNHIDDESEEPSRKKLKTISSVELDESSPMNPASTIPNLTNESSAHLLALNRVTEGP